MKKLLLSALLFTFTAIGANAQDNQENPLNKGLGFGFQLNQYQRDFGYGLNVTSPYMAKGHLGIRLRGNLMYYEHLKDGEYTWTPYQNVSLGFVGVGGYVADYIRLYGEGGLLGIFPSDKFSKESFHLGGYGFFGFEFHMDKGVNYFIEIGSGGSGATADKLPGKPIYSNGLIVGTGFRITLK